MVAWMRVRRRGQSSDEVCSEERVMARLKNWKTSSTCLEQCCCERGTEQARLGLSCDAQTLPPWIDATNASALCRLITPSCRNPFSEAAIASLFSLTTSCAIVFVIVSELQTVFADERSECCLVPCSADYELVG